MSSSGSGCSPGRLFPVPIGLDGVLVLSRCPPGEARLPAALRGFRAAGVDTVCALLPVHEAQMLGLAGEEAACRECGLEFLRFPIDDQGVPATPGCFADFVRSLVERVRAGGCVLVHCRAGIGRSGLVACASLISLGHTPAAARAIASAARGLPVPETAAQIDCLERLKPHLGHDH